MLADFNDPNSTVRALVTSPLLAASGVNYHNACHNGVVVENCPNFGLQCQVIGRLWRPGQEEKVHWKLLQTQKSLDPWIETRNLGAYASNAEAEAAIDDRIQGPLRTICAFEILRFYIGAGYNYYPRCWRPWNLLTSDEVREEGILLSAVAQWLMAHPEDAGDAVPMIEIAKRWNKSMPMTRDIMVGAARELGHQDYVKFNWFAAMDPSLGDPEERAELFKVLGI